MELTLTRDSVHAGDPLPWRPPVAGYWWADLAHGYRGDAQEVAKRWVTRPRTW